MLAQPLVAKVVNDVGNPVAGKVVNFRVTQGGGSVYAGSSISDGNGIVRERWTLGWVPGSQQQIEARGVSNSTGETILYGRFNATATMPTGISSVWLGEDNPAGGFAQDWFNPYNWSPMAVPTSTSKVLVPPAAVFPVGGSVVSGTPAGATIKKLVVSPGAQMWLRYVAYNNQTPFVLSVAGVIDAQGGSVTGQGTIAQTMAGTIRGTFARLDLKAAATLNGDLVVTGSSTNVAEPDGELAFHNSGSLTIGKYHVDIRGSIPNCNLIMTDPEGTLTTRSFGCDNGTFSAGTITAQLAYGFLPGHVSGTHTVVLDVGAAKDDYSNIIPDFARRYEFQNLRVKASSASHEGIWMETDTLLVKGSLFLDSGTLDVTSGFVENAVVRVLGDITIAAGATLHNEIRVEYKGALHNSGTVTGNALVHVTQ